MFDLIGAIVALLVWFLFTFVVPAGLGIVHALLALGVVLLIRWWALREPFRSEPPAQRAGASSTA